MANREYLVDVSAYQGTSMAQYHSRGATGIIVKGTEGQWYRNPLAVKQIASAHYHEQSISSDDWHCVHDTGTIAVHTWNFYIILSNGAFSMG